jgi:hypothetical protein
MPFPFLLDLAAVSRSSVDANTLMILESSSSTLGDIKTQMNLTCCGTAIRLTRFWKNVTEYGI